MTTADVQRPKLWLDMLVGFPQAVLNWFIVMLLAFVVARMIQLRTMRQEIRVMSRWLDRPENWKALMEPDPKKRARSAEIMATKLDTLHLEGHEPPLKSQLSQARTQNAGEGSGAADAESGGTKGTAEAQTGQKAGWGDGSIRKHALIVLMAEKAIRRLIVGDAQPELFREFCAARRAMVDESAWFLRYLSRALPALGFVGTILGILFALYGADGIVRASTQAERISAMAAVTGPLAFAFSHTFIALLGGLITGFLIDRETARERLALLAYEEALIEKIDLAEREQVQPTPPDQIPGDHRP
jgi:hypothetical protein